VGRYVLIITVRPETPFFLTATTDTKWSVDQRTIFTNDRTG